VLFARPSTLSISDLSLPLQLLIKAMGFSGSLAPSKLAIEAGSRLSGGRIDPGTTVRELIGQLADAREQLVLIYSMRPALPRRRAGALSRAGSL
jgi:hypothetical protein